MNNYIIKNKKTNKYLHWYFTNEGIISELETDINNSDKFNLESSEIIISTLDSEIFSIVNYEKELRKLKLKKIELRK